MRLAYYARVIPTFFKYSFQAEMAYRIDFFVWSLVSLGWFIFNISFYHFLFGQIDSVGGWNKGQVFVLQGFYFLLEFVLWGVLYANFMYLPRRINRGEIDLELTKPLNTQLLLSFRRFNLDSSVNIVMGIGTLVYGLRLSGVNPSAIDILMATLIFLIACVFLYAGYFITVTSAFWVDRLSEIVYLFPQIRQFAKLPSPAYHGAARFFFTFIIPAILISTVPSEALFGHYNLGLILTLIVLSILTLKLSTWFFNRGLRQYSSASS